MNAYQRLLILLGDGELHSGSALAESLGVSRTAVWKQLERLRELGVEIDAGAGQGYQLHGGYEVLEADEILAATPADARAVLADLEVFWELDSTNSHLLKSDIAPHARAVLADYQFGGRGRRGRRWMSPPGAGIWLSVGWTWEVPPPQLTALSLAVGAAISEVLYNSGVAAIGLKWPNDLQADGRKLGGILIDVQGDSSGPLTVVVGVGLNVIVPGGVTSQVKAESGVPPVGLRETGCGLSRNEIAGALVGAILGVLQSYSRTGFSSYSDVWQKRDVLLGQEVTVGGAQNLAGIAGGIDENGFLLVDTGDRKELVGAGDVTLRGVKH